MRVTQFARLLCLGALAAMAYARQDVPTEERHLTAEAYDIGVAHFPNSEDVYTPRFLKKKKHTPAPTPAEEEEGEEEEEGSSSEDAPAQAPANSPAASEKPANNATPSPSKKQERSKDSGGSGTNNNSNNGNNGNSGNNNNGNNNGNNQPAKSEAPKATTAAPKPQQSAPAPTEQASNGNQANGSGNTSPPPASKAPKASSKAAEEANPASSPAQTKNVTDEKIEGKKNEGVLDHSSEGSAEIDKIDLKNKENWESVYNDPPLLVIKASLYAFIAYNDSKVCDTFNMTLNAVERKPEGNDSYSYHVLTQINCTKDGVDTTKGKFVLNFVPEGKRLLLTECGHRENGEILNWMDISGEVPQCMTPEERKEYISQPMKHVHALNETDNNATVGPTQTNFLAHLKLMDEEGVAIAGSATVIFIAIIAVVMVFVARKRKAQKELERTIAGAKAEHAVEDDAPVVAEASGTVERKGLMDSAKAKPSDVEEGSFVNSPSVKV